MTNFVENLINRMDVSVRLALSIFFNKNIVGKIYINNNDTLLHEKRIGFYKIDDGLKNSMNLRLLRFEEMVKKLDHRLLIKKCLILKIKGS